jgi:hypothetical protein
MLHWVRSHRASDFPLAWERPLWSGRPAHAGRLTRPRERYHLSDFRAIVTRGRRPVAELAVHDLARVELRQSPGQRLRGTCTLVLHPKQRGDLVIFADLTQGPQLAFILELLTTDPSLFEADCSLVETALGAGPPLLGRPWRPMAAAVAAVGLIAGFAGFVAIAVTADDRPTPVTYPADDAIYPGGQKRSRAEIVAFMETEVMPFAREALGPLVGIADEVTCSTCHGRDAEARDWRMPAVNVLPRPRFRKAGLELDPSQVDAQVRNAVYGYVADVDKQARMAYMRNFIMPGMARLLHRPPYDFTQTYAYNRARFAFGCYHCHQVSAEAGPDRAPASAAPPSGTR